MNPWIAFSVVIAAQLCVFLVIAILQKRSIGSLLLILGKAAYLGFVFGIPFDLCIGQYLTIYSYVNGFGLPFLMINGFFSFGLWAATVLLLTEKRLLEFCLYVGVICAVYEITNYIFPVWQWSIHESLGIEMFIVFIGYCGLALAGSIVTSLLFKTHFRYLEWKFTKK